MAKSTFWQPDCRVVWNQARQATLECVGLGGPRYFRAAGCEIPDGTPGENLRA